MKIRYLLPLLLVLSTLAGAARSENPAQDDLLAQLAARSRAIQSLEGHFEQQKTIAVLPAPLTSHGHFTFIQGKEVYWETLMPVQSRVLLTPAGISFFDAEGKPNAPAQQAGAEVVARMFMGVIAGELDSLQGSFTLTATGSADNWKIQMVPRSANISAYITRIELRGAEFTEQLEILEANGDKTLIIITTDNVVRKPAGQAQP